MSASNAKRFMGFLKCPVCKKATRHYSNSGKQAQRITAYCDECRVLRIMFRGEGETK